MRGDGDADFRVLVRHDHEGDAVGDLQHGIGSDADGDGIGAGREVLTVERPGEGGGDGILAAVRTAGAGFGNELPGDQIRRREGSAGGGSVWIAGQHDGELRGGILVTGVPDDERGVHVGKRGDGGDAEGGIEGLTLEDELLVDAHFHDAAAGAGQDVTAGAGPVNGSAGATPSATTTAAATAAATAARRGTNLLDVNRDEIAVGPLQGAVRPLRGEARVQGIGQNGGAGRGAQQALQAADQIASTRLAGRLDGKVAGVARGGARDSGLDGARSSGGGVEIGTPDRRVGEHGQQVGGTAVDLREGHQFMAVEEGIGGAQEGGVDPWPGAGAAVNESGVERTKIVDVDGFVVNEVDAVATDVDGPGIANRDRRIQGASGGTRAATPSGGNIDVAEIASGQIPVRYGSAEVDGGALPSGEGREGCEGGAADGAGRAERGAVASGDCGPAKA